MKDIPVNILDDYWNDDCVPKGEIQFTHAYIEEYEEFTEKEKTPRIKALYEYITRNINLKGVDVKLVGMHINFTNLTHKRKERLVKELQASDLKYNGVPFRFFSES